MNLKDAISLINHADVIEKSNASWADLGCGAGLFTYALANLLQEGSTIVAIDKKMPQLQTLPNPHNIHIHTRQMDFTKDAIPVEGLDGILMANSLHYVADKMNFITHSTKQLAQDGTFLIVEYNTDSANAWVPYPASARSLQTIFAKAGYHHFTKLREMPSLYNSGKIYAAVIKR